MFLRKLTVLVVPLLLLAAVCLILPLLGAAGFFAPVLQGALAGAALALMLPLSGATREAEPFARLLVFPALVTAGVIAWQYLCSVGESLPLLDRLATADPRVLAAEGVFAAYLAVHCFRIREREE